MVDRLTDCPCEGHGEAREHPRPLSARRARARADRKRGLDAEGRLGGFRSLRRSKIDFRLEPKVQPFHDSVIRPADVLITRLRTSRVYQLVHGPDPGNLRRLEMPGEARKWRCEWDSNPR